MGALKEKFWKDAIQEYSKRLNGLCKLEIIELTESTHPDIDTKLSQEYTTWQKALQNINGKKIILDPLGKAVDSSQFSKILTQDSTTTFLIGSSNGFLEKLKSEVDHIISFGNITLPHQLFRVVLVEQIYRGFMIKEGRAYHK